MPCLDNTPPPRNHYQVLPSGDTEIAISRGLTTVVDAHGWVIVSPFRWFAMPNEYGTFFAATRQGRKNVYMHQMLVPLQGSLMVDHVDGDTLNNTFANLRPATRKQNAANSRISRANSSGFKGVSWKNRRNPWQAHIRCDGRARYLGSFATRKEAALAYDAAARQAFVEFAALNFPLPGERCAITGKIRRAAS